MFKWMPNVDAQFINSKRGLLEKRKDDRNGSKNMKLSLWQKIQLRINGYVFLRFEKREGWSGYLPIFAVKCPIHGLYSGAHHGYSDAPPQCPKCLEEAVKDAGL